MNALKFDILEYFWFKYEKKLIWYNVINTFIYSMLCDFIQG
jgi:hypothetical protein